MLFAHYYEPNLETFYSTLNERNIARRLSSFCRWQKQREQAGMYMGVLN